MANIEQLKGAAEAIKELITSKSCNPILVSAGFCFIALFPGQIRLSMPL